MATIKKDFIVKNGVQVGGDILPDSDLAYDIGSATARFKDLYLSGSTITLGNIQLKDNGDGTLGIFDSDISVIEFRIFAMTLSICQCSILQKK